MEILAELAKNKSNLTIIKNENTRGAKRPQGAADGGAVLVC